MRKTLVFLGILVVLLGSGLALLGNAKKSEDEKETVQGESVEKVVVKNVIDGDTLTLSDGAAVRLIGINAPEHDQPYYEQAKAELVNLTNKGNLDIQTDVQKTDMYGRTLSYLYSNDALINLEMVKSGLAVIETIPPNVSHADELVQAQQEARSSCKGIWEGLCSRDTAVCVQISAVESGKSSSDLNSEWIELTNTCLDAEDLTGYLIKDSSASNSYIFKDFKLGSKQKVKIYSGCSADSKTSLYWQCPARSSSVWNNEGDSAYLYDKGGKLVSQISY